MELDNATTHRHTGQEFTRVKRFGEIVICAGCQSADDVIFVCVASEQDYVSIRTLVAADLGAQLDPGDTGHLPICDHQGRMMFGQEVAGLAAVFGKTDSV